MSALAAAAADYLALRRALGFKLQHDGRVLPRFVAHLDALGADIVTVALALAWASGTGEVARNLSAVRGFARYLQALDSRHEVPPTGLVRSPSRRAVPHLFSEADVVALMAAARDLQPPLRAATVAAAIGLLATTGMRIGEVLALDVADIDWETGVTTVRLAKFNKSRHVPLSPSTLAALDAYRHGARRRADASGPALLVAPGGRRLSYHVFKRVRLS